MDQDQINQIWNKTANLINKFKRYDLEKRIQYVAKNAVTSELLASQIKETAIRTIDEKVKEQERQKEKQRQKDAIIENIQTAAKNALTAELIASQIKETAIKAINDNIEEEEKEQQKQNDIVKQIETVAKDAVTSELMASQIKETAIQSVQSQLKEEQKGLTEEEKIKNLAKQIILNLIKKHLPLIQTIIAIKKAAISAVTGAVAPKDITELIKQTAIEKVNKLVLEEQLYDVFEKNRVEIGNLNEQIKTIEDSQSRNEEDNKNLSDKRTELVNKTAKQQELLEEMAQIAEKESDLAKKISIYQELVKKYKDSLNVDTVRQYSTQIQNLNGIVNTLKQTNLQNELKNVAINKVLTSLPKVAEPKIDIKPLIENAAINKVKDALNDAVINDLKTGITAKDLALKNLIEANIKRNLEEIAIKTVERATIGSAKTAPGSSTGPNIENDLKNAAITALYRALLGVPRKPIDITKPQDKFDILITDKTYTYDEKGQPVEDTKLTKYDSILAKEQK